MKAEIKEPDVGINIEPLAVHVDIAAIMVGLSRRSFYRHFINSRRVFPVYIGTRAMIDVAQLRAAWLEFASDPQRRVKNLSDPDSV